IITAITAGSDTILNQASYELARAQIRNKLNNIAYKNNDLCVLFSTTDFVPGLKKHQYRLAKEDKWSDWKLGNVLKMQDLNEGNYNILIRFMNNEGVVSGAAELSFVVKPPFYRTWFAWFIYSVAGFILFFIFYKTYRYRLHSLNTVTQDENPEIFHKAEPSLPPKNYQFISTVDQEKKSRKTKWDKYEMATVLFSDIQGFTHIAEQMNPERLIDELDKFFFHFDSVVEKYNIEKIKTIGDAYMAAGGIPKKNNTNPIEVVLAALEMQYYMKQLKKTNAEIWDLRIGIHSGPVIAGTIGQKKRSYDIWGDTVNTASRMESSGEPGRVNVSGTTYNLIKDYFVCEYRGRLPVKYKGNIDMYFVKGLRPELSINLAGIPNRKFFLKLQLLRLNDLEEYVYDKLEVELPVNMYFHNLSHARQIYNFAGLLCKAEDLDFEETLMIRTACLLLPLGYISSYENPEIQAATIARELLPGYFYSDKQANLVSNLILSTKWPPSPRNLLEEIMADSRMEYLGRVDFIKLYKLLFLEHNEYLQPMEIRDWKENQIKILSSYSFYTAGARRLREIDADEQIKKMNEDNL
ncbi:MAG TPA: adenylate/guanylate cyclase domain-containing protein, partial [Bacteroidales bacterium]|nr:adenylate/guanylate cyclase domain-containing protein [Bacteroidales bacterium]